MITVKAVNKIAAQALAAKSGCNLGEISSESWPKYKACLGKEADKLELLFDIAIWVEMRKRNDQQFMFIAQQEKAQKQTPKIQIIPPKSGCKSCNR